MSSVREDPLTGVRTVIAPSRIPAPPAFTPGMLPRVATCPFCPGAEHHCRQELGRIERGGGWSARAFPNRRPGLSLEASPGVLRQDGLVGVGARGAHEVIVVGADHAGPTAQDRVDGLVLAARRLEDLAQDPGFKAFGWFGNRGVEAGASQPHEHHQLVAMPVLPSRLRTMLARVADDPDLPARLVEHAQEDGRVVHADEHVIAYTPWAPSHPFEVHILPLRPSRQWRDPGELEALGAVLHRLVGALDGLSGFTSHNLVGHFAPPGPIAPGFRWQVRVLPRVVPLAGFEAWSGGAMHPIAPELAAGMLRDAVA